MRHTSVMPALLVFCFAPALLLVQAPAPKPGAEVKKLHAELGHWRYAGEAKAGPGCLGGKFTGEMTCQMILGGFFLQCQLTEKEPDGQEWRLLEIDGYDPVNKNFTHDSYSDDGAKFSGALTIAGNIWTHSGKWVSEGKQYHYKGTFVFGSDLASGTFEDELSLDGKTWTTCEESKYAKVMPAPKK